MAVFSNCEWKKIATDFLAKNKLEFSKKQRNKLAQHIRDAVACGMGNVVKHCNEKNTTLSVLTIVRWKTNQVVHWQVDDEEDMEEIEITPIIKDMLNKWRREGAKFIFKEIVNNVFYVRTRESIEKECV